MTINKHTYYIYLDDSKAVSLPSLYTPIVVQLHMQLKTSVRAEDVAQLGECLPSIHKALDLLPSTPLSGEW